MAQTKYNIDDVVLCDAEYYHRIQKCIISMITITRKGIRYRAKTEKYNNQIDVWENEIIGLYKEKKDK